MATAAGEKTQSTSGDLQLKVASDCLLVSLECSCEFSARPDAIDIIRTEWEKKKIATTFDANSIAAALKQAATAGTAITNLVVARGQAPTPPVDARLEWSKDFFTAGYYVDPLTKYVDYHRKAATPSVVKDEVIATVYPPVPGQDGRNIFGAVLAAVKPQPINFRAGKHVIFDEAAGVFKADCNGRVKLNGGLIEVLDVYKIQGDIGPESGNIEHAGSLIISGGVLSEFKLSAQGDIEIGETIGSAEVDCGGNLTVHNGISSAPNKKITVKGNLHTKYLEHATVSAEGDVVVESEILDSHIRTTGKVVCPGRVRGGEIIATGGILIGEVGSHTESRTVLTTGINYLVANAFREAVEKSKVLAVTIGKLERELKKLEMMGKSINHKQREALTEIGFKLFEAREQDEQLTVERKNLAVQLQANRSATITIEKQVNPGTVLRVLDSQLEVQDALLGPIVATLDTVTRKLTLTSTDVAKKE